MPFFVFIQGKSNNNNNNNNTTERNDEIGATGVSEPEQNERETIAWNWNPNATSITRSESRARQNDNDDYIQQLSYNCYDQTLDRLMGEFNVNKRKQNWNRNAE